MGLTSRRPGHTPTNKLNNFQPEVHRQFTAIFPEGSKVKVQGTTKGKGFAGVGLPFCLILGWNCVGSGFLRGGRGGLRGDG